MAACHLLPPMPYPFRYGSWQLAGTFRGGEMIDLNAISDQATPGGCDRCGATQALIEDPTHGGIWHLKIWHADGCPFMRALKARNN